jgi:hypothetical protein
MGMGEAEPFHRRDRKADDFGGSVHMAPVGTAPAGRLRPRSMRRASW